MSRTTVRKCDCCGKIINNDFWCTETVYEVKRRGLFGLCDEYDVCKECIEDIRKLGEKKRGENDG